MEQAVTILKQISGFLWGWPALILIAGTGIYLTLILRFLPLRQLGFGFKQMFGPQTGVGTIGAGAALATSLSATIGTGNIVGVATAIHSGGPGALVWMWLIALVGMATKYAEAVLAVQYREKDAAGQYVGGPMYYIQNGLGRNWRWLAIAFAIFGMLAGFGIGNSVQANSVAHGLQDSFGLPAWITGVTLAVLVGLVVLGGVKRIASVATFIVPFMALTYLLAGLGDTVEDTLALCRQLVALGVYPFVVPFVPISGTPLEHHPSPSAAHMRRILEPLGALLRGGGLRSADIKAGCGRCGACSALSAFEDDAREVDPLEHAS